MYIMDALRTPIGRRGRSLRDISAVKLGSIVIKALLERNKSEGSSIDEVILGNAVGSGLGQNPARQAIIHAGLPSGVPGFTVNKVCGSGLKAVVLAAQAIACGDADVIMAGGAENASQCPDILIKEKTAKTAKDNDTKPGTTGVKDSLINDGLWCGIADRHMGTIAEHTADQFKISRREQDEYALHSYEKACAARDSGKFRREVVPVSIDGGRLFDTDERPRAISMAELSRLPGAFKPGGSVTAGNSPAPADGAAMLIIASEGAAAKFKAPPIARIIGYASVAVDPMLTFTAPALAVKKCLKAVSIQMPDVDLFEINEAFAVQAILTVKELGIGNERLNILGGTIALGHPLGASGARGLVTLLNALAMEKKKVGVTCVCLGGGSAIALAVRMLN